MCWRWVVAGILAGQGAWADVARIGATTYPTLPAAVAAAHSNDTIVLIGDPVLTQALPIAIPLTIVSDGAVRTISRTNAFADDLITVQYPGSLTLGSPSGTDASPTLVLDGGSSAGIRGGYSFIFAYQASIVIHPGVLIRNYSATYAALYLVDNGTLASLTMHGGCFSNNAATNSHGGALCSQGASLYLQNAVFTANAAPRGRGGAIFLEYASLVASNLVIHGNSADDYGGGIVGLPAHMDLSGGRLSANSAINGGGIANASGRLSTDSTRFESNHAFFGAALWSHSGSNVLRHSTFQGNQSESFGGACYSIASSFALSNCQIVANSSASYG